MRRGIRKVYVLLRCSRDVHENCLDMRDAVFGFRNILRAYTTRVEMDGVTYCVAADGFVNVPGVRRFRRDVWNLRTGGRWPKHVSGAKILVSNG